MTDKEVEELIVKLEKFKIELFQNKEKSKKLLVNAGIFTQSGKLTKHYKHLCIPQEQA